ncbi:hypothetical protein F0U60_43970 [Archangium minus]|uniref:Basic proline-rich protein n=1 Tax=Archangium minus TaxID=83450 RepID=A0ABY9X4R0_9BACT|nr:hypothetical protein F0U60_43970 [Archangium minus]
MASTVISTNLALKQWGTVFPGAARVAALVGRFRPAPPRHRHRRGVVAPEPRPAPGAGPLHHVPAQLPASGAPDAPGGVGPSLSAGAQCFTLLPLHVRHDTPPRCLARRVPQGAARPLHRPGSLLGRPLSAALLGPSAPALTLNSAPISPIRSSGVERGGRAGVDRGVGRFKPLASHGTLWRRSRIPRRCDTRRQCRSDDHKRVRRRAF